jgi:tRNA dimethylallyltransferase
MIPRIIALVGPTAVGKSAVAVDVAEAIGAEIVSCDALQVYRRMQVLTQAPTAAQRVRVAHHLIECIEPTESFNVGCYQRLAAAAIAEILARGRRVLLVGGTGLYLKALLEGLCEAPAADPLVRAQLWRDCRAAGSDGLYERLRAVDAAAAARIHQRDARRIVRALEVYTLTGRPLSVWWRTTRPAVELEAVPVIGLIRERAALYERINQRVRRMVEDDGVLEEARALVSEALSPTARQVHGLTWLARSLTGQVALAEALSAWQQQVRHYAKRQLTWFRRTPGLRWILMPDEEPAETTAQRLVDLLSDGGEGVTCAGSARAAAAHGAAAGWPVGQSRT